MRFECDNFMKTNLKLLFLLLAILGISRFAGAQGTAIGYQGRLNDGAAPATGLYDFTFAVHDADLGGAPLAGSLVHNGVPVTNGVFNVTLDFGPDIFTGPARWLEIRVRTNGPSALTLLAPRTALRPTPYSIFAARAANVASGAVTAGQLNTGGQLPAAGQFLSYNGGNLFWSDPGVQAGNVWSRLGANAYYNAGNVGIGTTTPSQYGHGGTARILEINNSGTSLHSQSHLMLYSGVNSLMDSAMGSVTWAQPGGMAAYIGAHTRSTTPNSPAAMLSFGTRKIGDAVASPKMVITEDGSVGIGTTTPTAGIRLDVVGGSLLRPGNGNIQFGSPNAELGMSIIPTIGGGNSRADLRFDGAALKLVAGSGTTPPLPANGIIMNTNGNVGIGMASLLSSSQWKLEVSGPTRLTPGGSGGAVHISAPNGESGIGIIGAHRADLRFDGATLKLVAGVGTGVPSAANGIAINTAGNVGMGTEFPLAKLDIRGTTRTCVLTITGGCDLAEPFLMNESDAPKGSVVVIDDENPGRVKLSDRAYDMRVAGIISGANGINPGISLQQEGVLEGGQNVSLSGRVYVQADAANGSIKPGDLLTTSDTPGHAMKVTDHAQAQGAILGKAMSALKDGKGMVLVLVTLQ